MVAESPNPLGAELAGILTRRFPESECTHLTTLPPRPAEYADWPGWVDPKLKEVLVDAGIGKLYSHQAATAQAAWAGHDVVVATGTSSGKSLGYQLPILTRLAANPTACALYLTPTKALGSDQLLAAGRLAGWANPAPYDGDTPAEARAGIRDNSRFVFSTPDMVHVSLLAAHQRWARFLRHLEFIVIDECHSYRGVFGANIALVPVSYTHL